ncbi:MAG: iron ABC transporter permease [Clostridiales bacterium]|nr:iron ABC transporter permease [Clostridiales bacterium]
MKADGRRTVVIVGILSLIAAFLISLFIGNGTVGTGDLLQVLFGSSYSKSAYIILTRIRIPRTLAALLCGAALSSSGLVLQTVLDNPLASPGIIGINSGAGLFVLIAGIIFPFSAAARQLFSFAGAVVAVASVYLICKIAGFSKMTLVLTGVAISSLFTAGTNTITTFYPNAITDKAAFNLGGLSSVSLQGVLTALPCIVICLVIIFAKQGQIELLLLGDETASGLGVNPEHTRKVSLLISALLAGSAVSLCGLLGFVGLIVPNVIRRIRCEGLLYRLILCVIYGSLFLIICDVLSRLIFYPYEIPVGLILSALGAPFFIWILISRRKAVR